LIIFPKKWKEDILPDTPETKPNYIASILHCVKTPEIEESMVNINQNLRKTFSKVFEPIPHVDELPSEPLAQITLKDTEKIVKTKNYRCPWKWKDVWYTLLQQHLDAGCFCSSHVPTGSGAFIVLKSNPTVLP
jgi:hypothetical protein